MPLFRIGEFPAHLKEWHFIQTIRRNIIRQAISLFCAQQTGQWRNDMAPLAALQPEDATFSAIASRVHEIFLAWQRSERFLGLFEIASLNIYYEDLIAEPSQNIDRVLAFLGLARSDLASLPSGAKPAPKLQSSGLNAALEAAFRAELGRRLARGDERIEALLPVPTVPLS